MRFPKFIHRIVGLEEDDLLSISIIDFFERYNIKSIDTKYRNNDNLICCKAYDTEFVVKPYRGKADWELLLKRLELAEVYQNFQLIERTPDNTHEG